MGRGVKRKSDSCDGAREADEVGVAVENSSLYVTSLCEARCPIPRTSPPLIVTVPVACMSLACVRRGVLYREPHRHSL
ncbi:hypothetical protein RRG08_038169 [Elysia crispata]|uniref:Uncharacterized protein n=1 Tax=Elysia crispata TaxID=231223 RepID=A0AAE0Z0D3_9GAST|nr:hypothetical protein RRG08_038169 [Elysia crispata]